eukprot:3348684-Alexandrium_andersonii.AAC.1
MLFLRLRMWGRRMSTKPWTVPPAACPTLFRQPGAWVRWAPSLSRAAAATAATTAAMARKGI